jgi:Polyketide cyclase / dehydrase and lipid transport
MILWRKWAGRAAATGAVLMTVVAVGGFFLPASLVVERERLIPMAVPELYVRVAGLPRWPEWSTWWQREPFLAAQFSGPASGVGCEMAWQSKQEGEGRAKIIAVAPDRQVALALDFGDRGEAQCQIRFEESADRQQTRVRWTFRTDFGGNTGRRYFGLFSRSWVERDLDESLARLETAALAKSAPRSTGETGAPP